MLKDLILRINNYRVRNRKYGFKPSEILILCPKCLQSLECGKDILSDPGSCCRCGKCSVADVVKISEDMKVNIAFAPGGRLACSYAKDKAYKAVVAVACPFELVAGIIKTFPKPVYAVRNITSKRPCVETKVAPEEIIYGIGVFTEI
ncbi:MAG: DUF116 domain-containing protein [Candidatus Aureabacteria bacterium]|nr:DUF116 domain-containing protein [Candidatus Auribacterota bacterium]